ncbi:hypothetical protein GCM10022288_24120 [Gryllotalpicola kribbensis]|jgi:hypothetical protein|uniref:Uncharacterized protein n=1 Tax=Gryllotalpicola kribbensis TaxID=993084 RepID=A0ABP8AX43_9MICO
MTDSAPGGARPEPAAGQPTIFRLFFVTTWQNARDRRRHWAPYFGDRLARRYGRGAILAGLAGQFFIWGTAVGVVLVVIGLIAWGGPGIGAFFGTMLLLTGVVLYYCSLGAERGAKRRMWRLVRTVEPATTYAAFANVLEYRPGAVMQLAREHPEVFPPRR